MIKNDIVETSRKESSHINKMVVEKFSEFKLDKAAIIEMLVSHPKVIGFLRKRFSKQETESMLYYISKEHEDFMQLRILSLDGKELVRLDRDFQGKIDVFTETKLRDKSDRDYFKIFSKLHKGEMAYSKLDLNIENFQIERPFKPTLRLGMPVYFKEKKLGYVVLNFNMRVFLNNIGTIGATNLALVDKEGFYLIYPQKSKEFSRFQNPQMKEQKFYPIWRKKFDDTPLYNEYQSAYTIKLFNGEKALAVYEPQDPPLELFKRKALQYSVAQLLALFFVLIPSILIIKRTIESIRLKKDELEDSRNQIQAIFNHSFDALIVIDEQATIIKVNATTVKLFGYAQSDLVGENVKILVPAPDHDKHDDYVKRHNLYETKIIGKERQLKALHKEGFLVPISLAVTPMFFKNRSYFLGTIRDLTQISELEMQQKEQETMLLHQSKLAAMGEMISAIAHQWRQPLNSIGLIVQELPFLYEDDELNEENLKKSVTEVMEQLQYMSQTIDDFRNFVAQGKEKKSFNALELVEEIYRLFQRQLKSHKIELNIICKDCNCQIDKCSAKDNFNVEDYTLYGFPSELKQALLNIVANAKDAILALQFTQELQREIQIIVGKEENSLVLEISDYAGGIDPQKVGRIFEPYYTTKEMGTGLGLFIAKSIVEKVFHGSITFSLQTNNGINGTRFIIQIPTSKDSQSPV